MTDLIARLLGAGYRPEPIKDTPDLRKTLLEAANEIDKLTTQIRMVKDELVKAVKKSIEDARISREVLDDEGAAKAHLEAYSRATTILRKLHEKETDG